MSQWHRSAVASEWLSLNESWDTWDRGVVQSVVSVVKELAVLLATWGRNKAKRPKTANVADKNGISLATMIWET